MKKFIGLCAIVVVIIGTCRALAAEPDVDLEPQLVCAVQSSPADGLIGFRYANLKEQLSGVQSGPGETLTRAWNTQNNLFGAQIGGGGIAAIYGNSAGTSFAISDNLVPINPFNFANASLQLTPHIALRGGYQMLWFDGAAVASRQVPTTGSFNFVGQATSHVDSAGTMLNQCAKPGLEVTW